MASLPLQTYQGTSGGRSLHTRCPPVEETVRCGCHAEKVTDNTTRKAKIKLIIACLVALVFMVGEVVGELQIKSSIFSIGQLSVSSLVAQKRSEQLD